MFFRNNDNGIPPGMTDADFITVVKKRASGIVMFHRYSLTKHTLKQSCYSQTLKASSLRLHR